MILIAGWGAGNLVFNGFEQHVSCRRRLLKLLAILTLFTTAGVLGGIVNLSQFLSG